jgi:hypothetical protein
VQPHRKKKRRNCFFLQGEAKEFRST